MYSGTYKDCVLKQKHLEREQSDEENLNEDEELELGGEKALNGEKELSEQKELSREKLGEQSKKRKRKQLKLGSSACEKEEPSVNKQPK